MSVGDFLKGIGTGAAKVGRVAGAVLEPLGERTAEVVSGEAPQIDEERRQQQYRLEDEQINSKAKILEDQLDLGVKYGTLTPDQQKQYVDAISQLYSHPRHQTTLLTKMMKGSHPHGTKYQAPQPALADPTAGMKGGTAGQDEQNKIASLLSTETQKADIARQQTLKNIDVGVQRLRSAGLPEDQINAFRNEAIEHMMGASTGTEKAPKGMKVMEGPGGVPLGIQDQDTGKQYLPGQLGLYGDAPDAAKTMWATVQKAVADKQAAADKKEKEASEKQQKQWAHQVDMLGLQMEKQIQLGNIRGAQSDYNTAEKAYTTASDLTLDMQANAARAKAGDQQAQIAILTDHAGGTTKLAGGRLTKPIMDELQNSLPFLQGIEKKFQVDNPNDPNSTVSFRQGVILSPEQVDQMLYVANNRVQTLREGLDRIKQDHPEAFPQAVDPASIGKGAGAKPVQAALGGKTGAKPIVQHSASTNQYRYSTDGGKTWQPGQPPSQ